MTLAPPLIVGDPSVYLGRGSAEIVDHDQPDIRALADRLAAAGGPTDVARAAHTYVRDRIGHSVDVADPRVTLRASDVLRAGVGLCFATSHLLVAVLRARAIPAGLCYQRLRSDDGGYVLHGLVAIHLNGRWHRQDPRGNRDGIDTRFRLDREQLAYVVDPSAGEVDHAEVFLAPHPVVVAALAGATDALDLCRTGLPESL